MPIQRQTAKKVRIVDLVSGQFVKKEGMEPSYVVTPSNDNVSRARITGTVASKFMSEDGNFGALTIDDSTATIRAKLWRETNLLKNAEQGDIVMVIGKVREYEDEIYIVPELIKKITPDEETLARLEVLKKIKSRKESAPAPKAQPAAPEAKSEEPLQSAEPPAAVNPEPEPTKPVQSAPAPVSGDLRTKVLSIIESSPDGIKYSELMQQAGGPEEELENIINELLGEGVCYEPLPGKIKKI